MAWTPATVAAFLAAFVSTVVMWWVYFHIGYERARRLIEQSSEPGLIARVSLNYLHISIIAGVILAAASNELLLADPAGIAAPETAIALIGGPALFVIGNLAFKTATVRRVPLSHMVGLALFAGLAVIATALPALALAGLVAAVLILVAAWEQVTRRPAG